jgi:hypothetical protein
MSEDAVPEVPADGDVAAAPLESGENGWVDILDNLESKSKRTKIDEIEFQDDQVGEQVASEAPSVD